MADWSWTRFAIGFFTLPALLGYGAFGNWVGGVAEWFIFGIPIGILICGMVGAVCALPSPYRPLQPIPPFDDLGD